MRSPRCRTRWSARSSSAAPRSCAARDDYGVPLVEALDGVEADLVVDLSDEPVLGPRERMLWASRSLALGLPYVGADFRFDPPPLHPVDAAVARGDRHSASGSGRPPSRAHVARVFSRDRRVVVVAMGRGGPAEPELLETPPTLDDLLSLSRSGRHAASDHLEAAALAGVPRSAAGGPAAGSRALRSVERARGRVARGAARPRVVVFDGSGAAVPPVEADARILVTNGSHDPRAGLNAYRVLISDLVVDTGGADLEAIRSISDVPIVAAELRLRPSTPLDGRRTAVFTTGPAPTDGLDAEIVHVSRNLARRDALREELEHVDADIYLVELKAAAVDVVAEAALARGAEVVLAANDVVSSELDERFPALVADRSRA